MNLIAGIVILAVLGFPLILGRLEDQKKARLLARQAEEDRARAERNRPTTIAQYRAMSDLEFLRAYGNLRTRVVSATRRAIRRAKGDESRSRLPYRGAGYIYVVPAKSNAFVHSDPLVQEVFRERLGTIFAAFDQCGNEHDLPAVFKIGFTARKPENRIVELNVKGNSFVYDPWEFNEGWYTYYPIRADAELLEQKAHEMLRHRNLFNELFYASFREIDAVVSSIALSRGVIVRSRPVTADSAPQNGGVEHVGASSDTHRELQRAAKDARIILGGSTTCKRCYGDGGAGGRCPECGGSGFA